MIPICLVTGFLGSGKTTLLRRIVETHRDRKLVYLVNEYAPADIDGRLLPLPEGQLLTLAGGSIFCRCLVGDFIRTLREIENYFKPEASGPEGVVIETSGIADPKVIQEMLQETKLDGVYSVRRIISIIDPGSFMKLIHTLPNIISQVEASDRIILNKTDLYPSAEIDKIEDELDRINPKAERKRAQFCRVEIELFPQEAVGAMCGKYALCADPNYIADSIRTDMPVDWKNLKQAIESIREDIYRFKGFVYTKEETLYVDYSASGWREESIAPKPEGRRTELVLIVRGGREEIARTVSSRIRNGEFDR